MRKLKYEEVVIYFLLTAILLLFALTLILNYQLGKRDTMLQLTNQRRIECDHKLTEYKTEQVIQTTYEEMQFSEDGLTIDYIIYPEIKAK